MIRTLILTAFFVCLATEVSAYLCDPYLPAPGYVAGWRPLKDAML